MALAQAKTYHLKNCSNQLGLTLLEVMVVVAILAALAALALPSVSSDNKELKAEIRKLSVMIKQIRNNAKLQNATYRLVIDLKEGKDGVSDQLYWVEKSTAQVLIAEDRERSYEERMDAIREAESTGQQAELANDGFSADGSVVRGQKQLPGGLRFEDVELPGFSSPVTTGVVFIHFFPTGLGEDAAIHLTNGRSQWTLSVHPLTGKAEVATTYISLNDLKDQE